MKQHLWIETVLTDLVSYSQKNDMRQLTSALIETASVLRGEVNRENAPINEVVEFGSQIEHTRPKSVLH